MRPQTIVVAVRREAIHVVELRRDRFGVQLIEAEDTFADFFVAGDGRSFWRARRPIGRRCMRARNGAAGSFAVEIWIVEIPAAEFFAGGVLAGHGAQRF